MPVLGDTNIIWRRFAPHDPHYPEIKNAIDTLLLQGDTIYITPQNLIEFYALATRPSSANGLGLTSQEANAKIKQIETFFPLLEEIPSIYSYWRILMESYECHGRQVYDARLVAVMMAHGIKAILTRNPSDFRRFHDIQVVEPHEVQTI